MDQKVRQAIDHAKAHLGKHPHPDWLVKVLGISEEEARAALVEDGWKDPRPRKEPAPQSPETAPRPRWKLDFHALPVHLVRWGLLALAGLATAREFGYSMDYFQYGAGGLIMALLISGGSTILPQAVAVLWPKRGIGYKLLGAGAFILGFLVLCASIYITTAGLWKQQTQAVEESRDQGAEAQARELEAIIEALGKQVERKSGELQESRGKARTLEGWAATVETRKGDALSRELTDLENRLEGRRLELAQTAGVLRVRGSLTEKAGEAVEVVVSITLSAIIALIGPLALGAALWGGLDGETSGKVELKKRRKP